jgi:hypothetical protein
MPESLIIQKGLEGWENTRIVCTAVKPWISQGHTGSLKASLNFTIAAGQINPKWGYLQTNQMSTSYKTDVLLCLVCFRPLMTFNRTDIWST